MISQTYRRETENIPFWSTLLVYARPYWKELIIAAICSALVGVAVAIQPLIIKWIIDSGISARGADGQLLPAETRIGYGLGFVALYAAMGVARICIWKLGYDRMVNSIEGLLFNMRSRFFRHVQQLCLRFHDVVSSGELFNFIMGSPIQSIKIFLQHGAMNIPYQAVSWAVATTALATFNLPMTGITLAMVVAVVLINRRSHFVVREMSSEFMRTESTVSKFVSDMLHGCRAVKIYAIEDQVTSSFDSHILRIRDQGAQLARRQQIEGIKPELVQYLGISIVYAVGIWFCVRGELEVGEFFAFVSSIGILMGPIMTLMQLNLIRASAEAGLTRIETILRMVKSTQELPPSEQADVDGQAESARRTGAPCVEFRNVSFAYDPERPVFKNLSCTIKDGQSVALVGTSGSGKTTFISLLMRLYDIDGGEILLNGVNLRSYGLADLRAAFGVVPQNPFLFQGTILDNIRVVKPGATEADARKAAEIANIDEFVSALPQGYQTWVGESGFNLSGGQKQRLAIARAVLTGARYFIFDEATSALDNESERRVQDAMESLMRGHTAFIIAHRLSTVRKVERVLVFDKGLIVQDGTFESLAAQPGIFRTLLDSSKAFT